MLCWIAWNVLGPFCPCCLQTNHRLLWWLRDLQDNSCPAMVFYNPIIKSLWESRMRLFTGNCWGGIKWHCKQKSIACWSNKKRNNNKKMNNRLSQALWRFGCAQHVMVHKIKGTWGALEFEFEWVFWILMSFKKWFISIYIIIIYKYIKHYNYI